MSNCVYDVTIRGVERQDFGGNDYEDIVKTVLASNAKTAISKCKSRLNSTRYWAKRYVHDVSFVKELG